MEGKLITKVKYNNGQKKFEIKVFEDNGMDLGKWTFNECDFNRFINIIKKKYGVGSRERDLGWAGL